MNSAKIAAAALLATLAVPAFAAQTATQTAQASTTATGWVAPYGQPVHEKTRAQVYQELVHAEQDGQLKYLNSTLYAHH